MSLACHGPESGTLACEDSSRDLLKLAEGSLGNLNRVNNVARNGPDSAVHHEALKARG